MGSPHFALFCARLHAGQLGNLIFDSVELVIKLRPHTAYYGDEA